MPKPQYLRDRDQVNIREDRLARDTCKDRPASSRGSGGSRPFVPWCSKRS